MDTHAVELVQQIESHIGKFKVHQLLSSSVYMRIVEALIQSTHATHKACIVYVRDPAPLVRPFAGELRVFYAHFPVWAALGRDDGEACMSVRPELEGSVPAFPEETWAAVDSDSGAVRRVLSHISAQAISTALRGVNEARVVLKFPTTDGTWLSTPLCYEDCIAGALCLFFTSDLLHSREAIEAIDGAVQHVADIIAKDRTLVLRRQIAIKNLPPAPAFRFTSSEVISHGIARAQLLFSVSKPEEQSRALQWLLTALADATGSSACFLAEVGATEGLDGVYHKCACIVASLRVAWSTSSGPLYSSGELDGLRIYESCSLYSSALSGKVCMENERTQLLSRQVAPGHPPVFRYLAVPISDSSELVIGVLSLYNSSAPYSEETLALIEPALSVIRLMMAVLLAHETLTATQLDLKASMASEQVALRVQGRVVAQTSHELRTSLHAICGFAQLLAESADNLTQDIRECAQLILHSGHSLSSHVRHILNCARLQYQDMEMCSRTFNLVKMLDRVVSTVVAASIGEPVAVSVSLPRELEPLFFCDEDLLHDLLVTLVDGMTKHSHRKAVVIKLSYKEEEADVSVLSISVMGQADKALSSSEIELMLKTSAHLSSSFLSGLGLELSMVADMVDVMNGKFFVQPYGVGGNAFTITLPKQSNTAASLLTCEDREAYAHVQGRKVCEASSIAIIDAVGMRQRMLTRYISRLGAMVTHFDSIDALLEMCTFAPDTHFDLLLCSWDAMPLDTLIKLLADSEHRQASQHCLRLDHASALFYGADDIPALPREVKYGATTALCVDRLSSLHEVEVVKAVVGLLTRVRLERSAFFRARLRGSGALPADVAHTAGTVLPTAAPVDSRSNADIEVLVVDDSTVNRKLLVRYVRRIFPSSVISEAVDGVEAVEKVKQRRFDVILMDLFMPNKDGVQATADIRKLFRNGVLLSKPPGIVVVTANAVVEELEKAKAAGADSILQKPLELEQLKLEMLSMMSKAQCAA